jgi:hypothetical protein
MASAVPLSVSTTLAPVATPKLSVSVLPLATMGPLVMPSAALTLFQAATAMVWWVLGQRHLRQAQGAEGATGTRNPVIGTADCSLATPPCRFPPQVPKQVSR